jgi:hypothetical protein
MSTIRSASLQASVIEVPASTPPLPMWQGDRRGITPRALGVAVAGIRVASSRVRSACVASERTTPPPAMISGRRAEAISSASRSMSSAAGAGRWRPMVGMLARSWLQAAEATSQGMSNARPGRRAAQCAGRARSLRCALRMMESARSIS